MTAWEIHTGTLTLDAPEGYSDCPAIYTVTTGWDHTRLVEWNGCTLEAKIANPKQQASSPQLSLGREFVLHYLNERGPSSSWPICQSAEVDGIGRGMEWADKHLRWLRMSGLAARTGRKDSFGRSIHQITEAGRARLQADEVAQ